MAAALYDKSGTLFATLSGRRRPQATLPARGAGGGYRFEDRHVIGFEPVALDGKMLGTLFVKSRSQGHRRRVSPAMRSIAALVIALSVLVAYLLSPSSQQSRDLAARSSSSPRRRARFRTSTTTPCAPRPRGAQELGQLTDAFNHMLTQIQQSRDTLARADAAACICCSTSPRAIGERQDLPSIFQVVVRSLEENLPVDFGCVCLYDAGAPRRSP